MRYDDFLHKVCPFFYVCKQKATKLLHFLFCKSFIEENMPAYLIFTIFILIILNLISIIELASSNTCAEYCAYIPNNIFAHANLK